jgi:uncharacterized repeat protein (TIGR01451 family)
VLVPLALVVLASLAPIGQARAARERSPEAAAAAETDRAEKENRKLAAKEERKRAEQREREQRTASRKAGRPLSKRDTLHPIPNQRERQQAVVTFECDKVKWDWRGFHDAPFNTVYELVRIDHGEGYFAKFQFSGSSATNVVTFPMLAPGGYVIDGQGHWRHTSANGLSGGFDVHAPVKCPPVASFSIEKLQEIEGAGGSFMSSPLTGALGQTVDYEIVVTNTGNVPLMLSTFTDPHCEAGTISEPPSATLEAHLSATFTCKHVITTADREAGSYSNQASVTGTPPPGDGVPVTHPSNEVIVNVPPPTPSFTTEKLQKLANGGGSYTSSTLTGAVGQSVDYEVLVKNTGTVALTLTGFTDPGCDTGTSSGGPIGGVLAVGASTSYTCTHVLTSADQTAGSHANVVTLAGTPAEGDESPVTSTTNTVIVDVPTPSSGPPSPNGDSHHEEPSSAGPKSGLASSGILSSTVSQPKTGVLAFSSAKLPALKGPGGCVRSSFRVSVKAAGVTNVSFYLDGHRLKTLSARSARRGLLSIVIDASKLKVGAHKLVARFSMAHTASTRATVGSRSITVKRCPAPVKDPRFTA